MLARIAPARIIIVMITRETPVVHAEAYESLETRKDLPI
jgi:hypothetical protein